MRRTLPLALAAAMAIGNFAFTATDVGGDRVYFTCEGSSPNTNLEASVGSWSVDAPTGAIGSGSGGCFSFDPGILVGDATVDTMWAGSYSGKIDSMTMHFYVGSVSPIVQGGLLQPSVSLVLTIDGKVVYETADEPVALTVTGDGPFPGTVLGEVTFDRLKIGAGDHDIELTYSTYYSDDAHFVMWGGSDADSGISFNPDSPAGQIVRV